LVFLSINKLSVAFLIFILKKTHTFFFAALLFALESRFRIANNEC
jgi:hypothetical protein